MISSLGQPFIFEKKIEIMQSWKVSKNWNKTELENVRIGKEVS